MIWTKTDEAIAWSASVVATTMPMKFIYPCTMPQTQGH